MNKQKSDQPLSSIARQKGVKAAPLRGLATIEAIMEAAERLWGTRGIEGVSLREIGIASGSAHKSSIGYHFGDRNGLIRAIFEARIPAFEDRRLSLLTAAQAKGTQDDPVTLLRIAFQPVFEDVDQHGRHRFAAFLRAVNRFPEWDGIAGIKELAPLAFAALDKLRQQVGQVPQDLFDARMRLIYELCYSAITDQDDNIDVAGTDLGLAAKIFAESLSTSAYLIFLSS